MKIRIISLLLRRKLYYEVTNSDYDFLISVLLERVQNLFISWHCVNNGFIAQITVTAAENQEVYL